MSVRRAARAKLVIAIMVSTTMLTVDQAAVRADPLGETTLGQTIVPGGTPPVPGTFLGLAQGPGDRYEVRTDLRKRLDPRRRESRRSLAFFGQLTDPQIVDEMSPARVELLDPAGGVLSAAWRPQEALGTQVFDQIVKNLNANGRSGIRQGDGRRRKTDLTILTGDQSDNMESNETKWVTRILDGKAIDPFSGKGIGTANPCILMQNGGSIAMPTAEQGAALAQKVAGREYTGVQDYGDYPGLSADRYQGFWDPDVPPPGNGGPYSAFPRYPGLMDRAQQPFKAEGLNAGWYASRGNHDGLVQGNLPASSLFQMAVKGCQKLAPSAGLDPASIDAASFSSVVSLFSDTTNLIALLNQGILTPPDADRAFISKVTYKAMQGGADHRHGFGLVSKKEETASKGNATYYAWSPRSSPDLYFIALDTVAEGGGAAGNLDNPQYRWLEKTLDRRCAAPSSKVCVLFGHHTLATMDNPTPDEAAGKCTDVTNPGCDSDPRNSKPIHLGQTGKRDVLDLLLKHPNVILTVTGHTHHNDVIPHKGKGGGFWEINTASHVDWPQQSRQIEVMDNCDGTLSIFGTILDHAAPIVPPPPGVAAAGMTDAQLASISRALSVNDPQFLNDTGFDGPNEPGGPGNPDDRNVELSVADPREKSRC